MFIDELSYFNIESNISIWERVNVLDLNPDCTLESPEGVKKKKIPMPGSHSQRLMQWSDMGPGQRCIFKALWVISHMQSRLKTTALLLLACSYGTFKWINKKMDFFLDCFQLSA